MNLKYFKSILLVFALVVFVGFSLKASAASNGEYKIDFGNNTGGGNVMYEPTLTSLVGWNNYNFSVATSGTVISLVDTNGTTSPVQMYFSNSPVCLNGAVYGYLTQGPVTNSLGYPASASVDYAAEPPGWFCGGGNEGDGTSTLIFTGLSSAKTYQVKAYGGNIFGATTNLKMTIGATTTTLNVLNNSDTLMQISGATTTATGTLMVTLRRVGGNDDPWYLGVLELIESNTNVAPVVDAGVDVIMTAASASTTITLTGTATDADGSIASTTWEMYSGPGGTISSPGSLTTTVTNLYPGKYAFRLYATDDFGKKVMDEKIVTIKPTDYIGTRAAKKIVFVGDSITYGWGSSPITTDLGVLNTNTWAKQYENYMKILNASSSIVNLGIAGHTTTMMATTSPSANSGNTIGNAVAQSPAAILITSSTNDPFNGISTSTTVANLAMMVAYATSSGIPVWIETPTPRVGNTVNQQWMRNYILTTYPTRSIDFFSQMADGSGNIISSLNANADGIHPNNAGYAQLYRAVANAKVYETITSSTSTAPAASIARGNTQATVSWSYPSNDGGMPVTAYKVYNAITNVLASTTASTTLSATFTGLTNGTTSSYYVTAVNVIGESASSTVVSTIPAAIPSIPQSLSATASLNQIVLSWVAPASDGGSAISLYNIYNFGTGLAIASTSSSTLQTTITGLNSGTTYSYYVTAKNIAGESASSTVLSITTATPATGTVYSGGSTSAGSSGIPASLLPFVNQPAVPGTTPAAVSNITPASFSRSLTQGAKGNDVKSLQQYLNAKGFSVASSGVGSKGKETNLFGPATKAALIKFQKAMRITPAVGFFGPVTRAAIK